MESLNWDDLWQTPTGGSSTVCESRETGFPLVFNWFSTGFYHPLYELEGSTQWLMKMQPESQNIHNFKQQVAELWAKAVKSGVEPTRNAPSYK